MNLDINPIIGILSALWLVMYISARLQLNTIKQKTTALILDEGKKAKGAPQQKTIEELYDSVFPVWESIVTGSAWFILHKSELFPIFANPSNVQKRINFTKAWMGAYLTKNGISLPASPELQSEIDAILALVPPYAKNKS